jgi:galactokinase
MTIPHRTYVAARLRDDNRLRVVGTRGEHVAGPGNEWRGDLGSISPDTTQGWPAYIAGVFWALQERGFTGRGMDLAFTSCVPVAAGLASSAALSCSVAEAIDDLWRLALGTEEGRIELANACVDAENMIAGIPSGGLDQHTLLRCREGEALVLDFRVFPPEATPCPLYFPDYGLALLVIDTTVCHDFGDGQYAERRAECERAARQLGMGSLRELHYDPLRLGRLADLDSELLRARARHVYSENDRVTLVKEELSGTGPAHERFVAIGQALSRSHASLKMDFDVSTPELDLAARAAQEAGALGARLVGAGFGGSVMALIRRTMADRTAASVAEEFRAAGYAAPRFLLV